MPIWQLRPDAVQGMLALEHRDGEKLLVTFSVINFMTGNLMLKQMQTTELWWTGLEALGHGILFTHGFGKEGFGRHKGISSIDTATGTVLWSDEDCVFAGLTEDKLLVQKSGANEAEAHRIGLDLKDGKVIAPAIKVEEAEKQVAAFEATRLQFLQLPVQHRQEDSPYFNDLIYFISQKTAWQPVGAIDYLETTTWFITGFYIEKSSGKRQYRVMAFSLAGELWLEELLEEEVEGIGSDCFFIAKDILILIKNRRTLLGYAL